MAISGSKMEALAARKCPGVVQGMRERELSKMRKKGAFAF